jgi:CheY-like chemotaxis protein
VKTVVNTAYQEVDEVPATLSKQARADLAVRERKTLLLVDDEDAIRQIGQELLEDMGYNVLLAKNGQEAVEVYQKKRDEIDIILLDIIMPVMGGREAYDRLKEINPKVKVLVWSGANVDNVANQMLKRGCKGFIHKPFSIKRLSETIRKILDKA